MQRSCSGFVSIVPKARSVNQDHGVVKAGYPGIDPIRKLFRKLNVQRYPEDIRTRHFNYAPASVQQRRKQ